MSDCFKHGHKSKKENCPQCAKLTKAKQQAAAVPVFITKAPPPLVAQPSFWTRLLNKILSWFK